MCPQSSEVFCSSRRPWVLAVFHLKGFLHLQSFRSWETLTFQQRRKWVLSCVRYLSPEMTSEQAAVFIGLVRLLAWSDFGNGMAVEERTHDVGSSFVRVLPFLGHKQMMQYHCAGSVCNWRGAFLQPWGWYGGTSLGVRRSRVEDKRAWAHVLLTPLPLYNKDMEWKTCFLICEPFASLSFWHNVSHQRTCHFLSFRRGNVALWQKGLLLSALLPAMLRQKKNFSS